MSVKTKKWVLKSMFDGLPKREDFEIIEEELPLLKDGEFLVEARWISVDPYLRLFGYAIGKRMIGDQVARVIESKNVNYNVGDLVFGHFGWQSHSICDGNPAEHRHGLYKIDPAIPLPDSTALGILGMPGATAYFGLQDVCKPLKEGETLVVSAAAGAVGSVVGQIGKIRGMRVVGFAGSDEKVEYLKSIGFDAAYNYKTVSSLADAIKEGCPNGVDVFFDNVGGEFFETVLSLMNTNGRIAVCGSISQYNTKEPPRACPIVTGSLIGRQIRIEGFMSSKWKDQWPAAFLEMAQWIQEDKLKYKEIVFEGFDNIYDGFMSLFSGKSIGKVVIKV